MRRPDLRLWAALLKIGLPAGAEFALMGVYLFVVYWISRPFGASAQAGFGIGMRIIQALRPPRPRPAVRVPDQSRAGSVPAGGVLSGSSRHKRYE